MSDFLYQPELLVNKYHPIKVGLTITLFSTLLVVSVDAGLVCFGDLVSTLRSKCHVDIDFDLPFRLPLCRLRGPYFGMQPFADRQYFPDSIQ